jgi:bifunctional non-homologous end joining protein LigD
MAVRKNLREYRRKRDFKVTPEPAPEARSSGSAAQPRFMVHKHDATRLHYDVRLEMDGALASWAVPKGPSYDPGVKRLAVQTEDHPLEYGHFEGRIPDGEYGAGDSIIWDEGTYDTVPPGQASAQRKKGHLTLQLVGHKLKGRWHLVRTRPQGGKSQWLMFKAKDELARADYDVVAQAPESVVSGRRVTRGPVHKKTLRGPHPAPDVLLQKVWPPMLATLSDASEAERVREGHWLEVKYDGYRALAACSGGKVGFLTRNGIDLSSRFPDIARALGRLVVGEAVLDGEVIALDAKGVSRFSRILSDDEHRYALFDLLWLEGQDLRGRPLEERRELLQSLLANTPRPLEISERVDFPYAEALALARKRGWEGLIAKARGSTYRGGRTRDWLKLKVVASQELAILGFTPYKGGTRQIGALLLGVYRRGTLHFAGKVGTGYTQALRRDLYRRLKPESQAHSAASDAPRIRDAVWVKPKLVGQVAFTEWTSDGKLRHPSFQGLRLDKKPEECELEKPIPHAREGKKAAPRPKLAARVARPKARMSIDVPLTHPDRVVYPKDGLTKTDVFAYYGLVAPVMLPALEGRPLTLQQWPKGISQPGFFRQNVAQAPDWVRREKLPHERRTVEHVLVDRPETLLFLANHSALTLHIWNSRLPHLDEPDWVVFDLDPAEGKGFETTLPVAHVLHRLLEQLNLDSVPKTSGKRGLHVLVPLARGHTYEDVLDFAQAICGVLEKGLGDQVTTERSLAKRKGRLYLDAFQNGQGKTVVAPYSLRAIDGAPVSAPLRWSEVKEGLDPKAFSLRTLPTRLDSVGDLFQPALHGAQRLPRLKG